LAQSRTSDELGPPLAGARRALPRAVRPALVLIFSPASMYCFAVFRSSSACAAFRSISNSAGDHDFVQMLFASGGTSPSLILVRDVHSPRAADLVALLLGARFRTR
jgi:hypothetical protein